MYISYKKSKIHYCQYGSGPALLVCLHGYGQNVMAFAFLEKHLGQRFTLLAIDMPFHGQTKWNDALLFTPSDLYQIIISINPNALNGFQLLGYSMGGRLALSLYQQYPDMVKNIYLLAPDGLHKNRWYRLATQTIPGNKLFKFTMHQPSWFLKMVRFGGQAKLLNKSVLKFVQYYLEDKQQRENLYNRWTILKSFTPNLVLIKRLLQNRETHIHMLFGEHDRIILYQKGEQFAKGAAEKIRLHIVNAGHHILSEKYIRFIMQLFE